MVRPSYAARCQLLPYSKPMPEVVVAELPSLRPGGRAAGTYGLGMLWRRGGRLRRLRRRSMHELAAVANLRDRRRSVAPRWTPSRLRLVGSQCIAETTEAGARGTFATVSTSGPTTFRQDQSGQARRQDFPGGRWWISPDLLGARRRPGTPEDAIRQIQRLEEKQGHFGAFLQLAHNWAPIDATKKSYELFARHDATPNSTIRTRAAPRRSGWVEDNARDLMGAATNAAMATIQKHFEDKNSAK